MGHGKELKNLRNISVTVIPIEPGEIGTVSKALKERLKELEIRGRFETIQTKASFRSAEILRIVLETFDYLPDRLQREEEEEE